MNQKNNQPILIVGSHRSGSTWVGKMLTLPFEVKYISEPFNPKTGLKIFDRWFEYICEENEEKFLGEIKNLIDFRGRYNFNLPALKYWANNFLPGRKRPLIKDPIASFSADWLANRFGMEVLVLMRHPVAFYSSLKRVGWHFDFENFLSQEKLMRDYLSPFESAIRKKEKSFAEEAAWLWLCIYSTLDQYLAKNQNWILKRHEDLSMNPMAEFEDLYQKFNLPFTDKVRETIQKYSKTTNPAEITSGQELVLARDSQSLVKNWKKHISAEETTIIKEITRSIADKYYSESDW